MGHSEICGVVSEEQPQIPSLRYGMTNKKGCEAQKNRPAGPYGEAQVNPPISGGP